MDQLQHDRAEDRSRNRPLAVPSRRRSRWHPSLRRARIEPQPAALDHVLFDLDHCRLEIARPPELARVSPPSERLAVVPVCRPPSAGDVVGEDDERPRAERCAARSLCSAHVAPTRSRRSRARSSRSSPHHRVRPSPFRRKKPGFTAAGAPGSRPGAGRAARSSPAAQMPSTPSGLRVGGVLAR